MLEISRQEHINWAKQRAIELARAGNLPACISSIATDLQKHPETQRNPVPELALQLYMVGELSTPQKMVKFIEEIT